MPNRAQWQTAVVGSALLLVQGMFPPWTLVYKDGRSLPNDWHEGFSFLLTPLHPLANATYQYGEDLRLKIDWLELSELWTVTVLLTVAVIALFRRKPGDSNAGFLQMLTRRKLWFSFAVGAGFPLPFLGYPAVIIISWLAKAGLGFESGSWFIFLPFAILAFAGFIYFAFYLVERTVSSLSKKTLISLLILVLFGVSFATPMINNYLDHVRQELAKDPHQS